MILPFKLFNYSNGFEMIILPITSIEAMSEAMLENAW